MKPEPHIIQRPPPQLPKTGLKGDEPIPLDEPGFMDAFDLMGPPEPHITDVEASAFVFAEFIGISLSFTGYVLWWLPAFILGLAVMFIAGLYMAGRHWL